VRLRVFGGIFASPGVRLCFAELCVFASDLHVFPCVLLCFRVFVCDLCVCLCYRVFTYDLRVCAYVLMCFRVFA